MGFSHLRDILCPWAGKAELGTVPVEGRVMEANEEASGRQLAGSANGEASVDLSGGLNLYVRQFPPSVRWRRPAEPPSLYMRRLSQRARGLPDTDLNRARRIGSKLESKNRIGQGSAPKLGQASQGPRAKDHGRPGQVWCWCIAGASQELDALQHAFQTRWPWRLGALAFFQRGGKASLKQ